MRHATSLITPTLLLTLVCTSALAAGKPETVELGYGWKPGMQAQVSFSSVSTRNNGDKQSSREMSGTYRMLTQPAEGGLRIDYFAFGANTKADGTNKGIAAELQELVTRIGQSVPSIMIEPNGDFGGVMDMEGFHGRLTASMQEWMDKSPSLAALKGPEQEMVRKKVQESMTQMMNTMLSPAALEQRMAEDWNLQVGTWVGANLEKGETYRTESEYEIAALNNVKAPLIAEFKYLGKAACNAKQKSGCVKLELHTRVESTDVARAIEETTNRMGGEGAAKVSVSGFQMEQTTVLLTEAKTLIPHKVETTKTTTLTFNDNGQESRATQVEKSEQSYSYDRGKKR